MELLEIAALLLLLLAALLAGGVWIAVALMASGWVGMQFVGGNIPAGSVLATTIWVFNGTPRCAATAPAAAPMASISR